MTTGLKSEFESNGYLKVPQALEPEDLSVLITCADRLIDEFSGKLKSHGQLKSDYRSESFESRIVSILQESGEPQPHWTRYFFGPELHSIVTSPRLLNVLSPLVGPEVLFNGGCQLRSKQPTRFHDQLSNLPWHQDTQYYGEITQHLDIVTVWIPLVDVDESNGCLWIIPGSHRWGLLHGARDHEQNMRTRENVEKRGEPISIPMKTRDILLFHNLTFHSSRENRTQRARWNVDIRFMANPACRILSDEEREAEEFLAEKMRKSKKPSLVVQGKGAGVRWEDWRKSYSGRLQTLGDAVNRSHLQVANV